METKIKSFSEINFKIKYDDEMGFEIIDDDNSIFDQLEKIVQDLNLDKEVSSGFEIDFLNDLLYEIRCLMYKRIDDDLKSLSEFGRD